MPKTIFPFTKNFEIVMFIVIIVNILIVINSNVRFQFKLIL